MKQGAKTGIIAALALLLIALIVVVKTVDVAAIGPEGTSVGLSGLNGTVASVFGFSATWYTITKLIGLIAFAVAGVFALLGLYQWIKGKSLRAVDRNLLLLAGLYAVTAILYVLFEKVVINYRPVIIPGDAAPEPSFPSTHTMLAVVVFGSALLLVPTYLKKNRAALRAAQIVLWGLLIVTVIGRLISGVHWLTDIVGGILLGALLLSVFKLLTEQLQK